jgi:hypothetical protein
MLATKQNTQRGNDMNKAMLLLVLASLTSVSRADEACVVKNVRLPVVEVNDLHQEMDLPETTTTCTNGKCESHIVKVDHFATEAQYQIVLAYTTSRFVSMRTVFLTA